MVTKKPSEGKPKKEPKREVPAYKDAAVSKEVMAPKASDKPWGAMERCQAVLSVWTERRKPTEVCREMKVPYALLSHWQDRALEGMLQALEPRVNLEKGAALPPRLLRILEK